MKRKAFIRELTEAGCYLGRHGAEHDIYVNPRTGKTGAVPRHTELAEPTCRRIRKALGLPEPTR